MGVLRENAVYLERTITQCFCGKKIFLALSPVGGRRAQSRETSSWAQWEENKWSVAKMQSFKENFVENIIMIIAIIRIILAHPNSSTSLLKLRTRNNTVITTYQQL